MQFIPQQYPDFVNAENEDKWNAVMFAAKYGHVQILQFLHENKNSLTSVSESNRTVLHIACDHGHIDACKYLVETCPSLLTTVDHKGRHAGHFAVRSGNIDIVEYLETKMDLTKDTYTGMNLLHMASLHCHSDMCRYLLQGYPDLNEKKTANEWTTLHFVAAKGKNNGNEIEIFEMLLSADKKVDIKGLTIKKNFVLTLAIKYNEYDFAEYLFNNYYNLLNIPGVNNPRETGNEDPNMKILLNRYLT